jgi:hypothetical protein
MKTRSGIKTSSLKTHLLPSAVSRDAQTSKRVRSSTTETFVSLSHAIDSCRSRSFFGYVSIKGSRNISCEPLNALRYPLPSTCRSLSHFLPSISITQNFGENGKRPKISEPDVRIHYIHSNIPFKSSIHAAHPLLRSSSPAHQPPKVNFHLIYIYSSNLIILARHLSSPLTTPIFTTNPSLASHPPLFFLVS